MFFEKKLKLSSIKKIIIYFVLIFKYAAKSLRIQLQTPYVNNKFMEKYINKAMEYQNRFQSENLRQSGIQFCFDSVMYLNI